MISPTQEFGKAIRPLFADLVTYVRVVLVGFKRVLVGF